MDIWQRQKMMFKEEEMKKISNLVVLIAGVGGLGTHQALELQRIGVKKIYLIDDDRIEASNLNRQILYGKNDLGRDKVARAKEMLDSFGLGTEVIAIKKRIGEKLEIPTDVGIILDALDNFSSRYVLEELARKRKLPLIHGAIHSWYGQLTTISPGKTPTLREIFGEDSMIKTEIPAFSPVVSVLASLQVIELVKVILNKEDNLINRLMIIDLADYTVNLVDI